MTTILIVDDYEQILISTKAFLEVKMEDVKILTANHEEMAFEIIKSVDVDIIITDLMMTQADGGISVLSEAKKKDPLVMVIIMTAYDKKLKRSEAFELGAFDCIIKASAEDDDSDTETRDDELYYKTKNAIQLRKSLRGLIDSQNKLAYFERYFDPVVIDKIKNNPSLLAPTYKKLTIVFWDIRGFSSLCDKLKTNPNLIKDFLKEHFEIASNIILKKSGVLDKFIGDGVMALFGAFDGDKERGKNAIFAVETAIELQNEFKILYDKHKEIWKSETADDIDIGIGCSIHTGNVIVGNLGTDRRDYYTAIGHDVNLTSRIEKEAKRNQILLSGITNELVKNTFVTKQLENPIDGIKGIPGKYYVYEVIVPNS